MFELGDPGTSDHARRRAGRHAAPHHRWDRDFFIAYVVLIWISIVMGFGSDMIHHFTDA